MDNKKNNLNVREIILSALLAALSVATDKLFKWQRDDGIEGKEG